MLDFHQKRRLVRFLYSRAFLSVLVVPVGFFAYVAWNAYDTSQEAREKRLALGEELTHLEARAAVLENDIANLDDPRGVEAELRKRYQVGKEGEELIVLVDEPQPEATKTPVVIERSWWETVQSWF